MERRNDKRIDYTEQDETLSILPTMPQEETDILAQTDRRIDILTQTERRTDILTQTDRSSETNEHTVNRIDIVPFISSQELQNVEPTSQQSPKSSPQQLHKLVSQQPVEFSLYKSKLQFTDLSPQQQYLTHQPPRPSTSVNQLQIPDSNDTCSRRNSTNSDQSIDYCCNSQQEIQDPNPMELVVSKDIKISNVIDLNRYYDSGHTTTELSTSYDELP